MCIDISWNKLPPHIEPQSTKDNHIRDESGWSFSQGLQVFCGPRRLSGCGPCLGQGTGQGPVRKKVPSGEGQLFSSNNEVADTHYAPWTVSMTSIQLQFTNSMYRIPTNWSTPSNCSTPSFLRPWNIFIPNLYTQFSFSSFKDNNLIFIWLIQH